MPYMYQPTKTFTPIPEDIHVAILVEVIELGMQPGYQGEGYDPKLSLTFELPETLRDDGKPFRISKQLKISLHEKSNLLKYVNALLGHELPESEKYGFSFESLLGKGCRLTITHGTKQTGDVFAKIDSVTKLSAGAAVPKATSELVFYDFESPDIGILHNLPDWLQKVIDEGKPWSMDTPSKVDAALKRPVAEVETADADFDDDIPY